VGEFGGGCVAISASALCQKILDILVAEVESVVQPDRVANDFRMEAMAFVCVHPPILSILAS
jgi:hypothetical protein